MPEFLSDEWIAAFDRAVRDAPELRALGAVGDFSVEQVVRDVRFVGADHPVEVAYRIRCTADGVRVGAGGAEIPPTLRLECDHATAVVLARGTSNAQRELATGALRVTGDLAALVARADVLVALGDVLAGLRRSTSFPGDAL